MAHGHRRRRPLLWYILPCFTDNDSETLKRYTI